MNDPIAQPTPKANFLPGDISRPPPAQVRCVLCGNLFEPVSILHTVCDHCADQGRGQGPTKKIHNIHPSWPARAEYDVKTLPWAEPIEKAKIIMPLALKDATIGIIGDRGRGKTVMAMWIEMERIRLGRLPGIYTRAHDLFALIRRAWHPQSKDDEWTVLERFRNTPFLVIDEFQERSESEWENRTLANILDHRHADMRPSVIIANLSREEFGRQIGPSILDRISQTGGLVECTWGNLRTAPCQPTDQ